MSIPTSRLSVGTSALAQVALHKTLSSLPLVVELLQNDDKEEQEERTWSHWPAGKPCHTQRPECAHRSPSTCNQPAYRTPQSLMQWACQAHQCRGSNPRSCKCRGSHPRSYKFQSYLRVPNPRRSGSNPPVDGSNPSHTAALRVPGATTRLKDRLHVVLVDHQRLRVSTFHFTKAS